MAKTSGTVHRNREKNRSIGNLRKYVFEPRTSTGIGPFAPLAVVLPNVRQTLFIRERTLDSTILLAFRHITC